MSTWPRTKIGIAGAFALVGTLLFAMASCSEEENAPCSADTDCLRGEVCEDSVCEAIECARIGDCPGSGRTCLMDLQQCSIKECAVIRGGEELTCPDSRSFCLEAGPYVSSCVAPEGARCGGPSDCAVFGPGFTCCDGLCAESCGGDLPLPVADMGAPTDDGGVPIEPTDAGPGVDQGPSSAGLCGPCQGDLDCASLGEGAKCTALGGQGSFCTSYCENDGACPSGFRCVEGPNQCLPISFQCEGCLVTGCADGETCNANTGECLGPQSFCGACSDDDGCGEGLTCARVGRTTHCLSSCAGGCAAGQICDEGLCKPMSGQCDACQGTCAGNTPYCDPDTAQCKACGPGVPCGAGQVCNVNTFTCEASAVQCATDIDCLTMPGLSGVCLVGQCVDCLVDSDCRPRHACSAQHTCEPSPCGGVTCQAGSSCDATTGRCTPGCSTANDCADPTAQACDSTTGQCYYTDGTCDLGGGSSVCGPGSQCVSNFIVELSNPGRGVCNCESSTPGGGGLFDPPPVGDIVGCLNTSSCDYGGDLFGGGGFDFGDDFGFGDDSSSSSANKGSCWSLFGDIGFP